MHGLCDKRRIRLYMTRHDSQKQKDQGVRKGAYISNKSDLVKGRLRVSHTGLRLELVLR